MIGRVLFWGIVATLTYTVAAPVLLTAGDLLTSVADVLAAVSSKV